MELDLRWWDQVSSFTGLHLFFQLFQVTFMSFPFFLLALCRSKLRLFYFLFEGQFGFLKFALTFSSLRFFFSLQELFLFASSRMNAFSFSFLCTSFSFSAASRFFSFLSNTLSLFFFFVFPMPFLFLAFFLFLSRSFRSSFCCSRTKLRKSVPSRLINVPMSFNCWAEVDNILDTSDLIGEQSGLSMINPKWKVPKG